MNRRDFIKNGSLFLASTVLAEQLSRMPAVARPFRTATDSPNVLVVVFDTLAAAHMSLYGYRRDTTPNLERFAQRSTVFHSHYAGANFTTPGTASLLTGMYPWTHRAFNHAGTVVDTARRRNLFQAFSKETHFKIAYSHNLLANSLLYQCGEALDLHLSPYSFTLASGEVGDRLFPRDAEIASRSFDDLIFRTEKLPSSLFLSLADRVRVRVSKSRGVAPYRSDYPRGVQELFKLNFILEHAIDGMTGVLDKAPQPFLAYFHLLPPHEPYRPHRDFVGIFDDKWNPAEKEKTYFAENMSLKELRRFRRQYDEFLAYADVQFGRLLDYLEASGHLDDTIVVFTSDHGQMFERGIHGHVTSVLYDPLIRVPLLISLPGQQERHEVTVPTSCVDLLPTLLHATGQTVPDWCEGDVLPLDGAADDIDNGRSVFALEAKRNPKNAPLKTRTIAMIKGDYKLVHYAGYRKTDDVYELFDIRHDPEEREDLALSHRSTANELKAELMKQLEQADEPYRV